MEEMEGSQGRDDHGPQGNVGEKPRATSRFFEREAAAAGLSTGHRHLKKTHWKKKTSMSGASLILNVHLSQ